MVLATSLCFCGPMLPPSYKIIYIYGQQDVKQNTGDQRAQTKKEGRATAPYPAVRQTHYTPLPSFPVKTKRQKLLPRFFTSCFSSGKLTDTASSSSSSRSESPQLLSPKEGVIAYTHTPHYSIHTPVQTFR